MKIYQCMRLIKTKGAGVFHELIDILEDELKKSGIKDGLLIVSVLHTTCAIVMQEPDEFVHHDSILVLDKIVPSHLDYRHTYEGVVNAQAHQRQMLVGNSKIIPVKGGSLVLGSWQKPFLIEFFEAMERKIFITVIGV